METRNEPAPRQDSGTKRLVQAPPCRKLQQDDTAVRVSVPNDKQDEEEKEAGYGHGV